MSVQVGLVGGACADVVQTFHRASKYEKKDKFISILKMFSSVRRLGANNSKATFKLCWQAAADLHYPDLKFVAGGANPPIPTETAVMDFAPPCGTKKTSCDPFIFE